MRVTLTLPRIDAAALLAARPPMIAAAIRDRHAQGLDDDAIGAILAAQGVVGVKTTPPPSFWARLNDELHLLICTDDPKYRALRAAVATEDGSTSVVPRSTIASVVGAHLGVAAGLVTPLVAVLLLALGETSTQAWCAQWPPPAGPPLLTT